MLEISTSTQIGLGLAGMGLALIFLGILFLFDKGLLAIGNVSVSRAMNPRIESNKRFED